jgi:hypothetical protein
LPPTATSLSEIPPKQLTNGYYPTQPHTSKTGCAFGSQ